MIIGIPKELTQNETRSSITASTVKSYSKFGFKVMVESGAGALSYVSDSELKESGAEIVPNASDIYQKSTIRSTLPFLTGVNNGKGHTLFFANTNHCTPNLVDCTF